MNFLKLFGAAVIATTVTAASSASSAVIVFGQDVGGDAVFSYSGTLDTAGLTLALPNLPTNTGSIIDPSSFMALATNSDLYVGSITLPTLTTSANLRGLVSGDNLGFGSNLLFVNAGYTSGDQINGSLTFQGRSLADLGITAGRFVTTLPSDTITIEIGNLAVVPLPAGLPLLLAGLGGLGLMSRRKKA